MDKKDFRRANILTKVIREPKQKIFTFGDTRFRYHIVSSQGDGAVVRQGSLICGRPLIITPESMSNFFPGFSHEAVEFAENMGEYRNLAKKLRILGYQFRHEMQKENSYNQTVKDILKNVVSQIPDETPDAAVATAPNDIWALSLMKISIAIISRSFIDNVQDLEDRGFYLSAEEKRKEEIEVLFSEAATDRSYMNELGDKLQEYKLFDEYEDRFFQLVKSK